LAHLVPERPRAGLRFGRSGQWLAWLTPWIINLPAALIYLVLPSLIYSFIYKSFRIVLDPILLITAEALIPVWARRVLRLAWILLCGCVLLMDWNIYSESYLFYGSMLGRIVFTPHGLTILSAMAVMTAFLLLPSRILKPNWMAFAASIVIYTMLVWVEGQPWAGQYLPWIRTPFERAVQAAQTDRDQFFNWSVTGHDGGQSVVTHHLYDSLAPLPAAVLPPKIMMFMMESWGERPADLDALRKRLLTLPGVKSVESGYDQFHGSTLPGEVRELCGTELDFKKPKALSGHCLPRQLAAEGYQTTAFHGFDGYFYSRDVIYPALGFDKIHFRKDIKAVDTCGGAFPGRCDDDTTAHLLAQAAQPGLQFSYMMSLSAHAVIDPATLKRPYVVANQLDRPGSDGQVLDRAMILLAVRSAGANAALANGLLYFAGDHNPPEEADALGLPRGQIPYLLVRLKP
jgi:hypothetical protein